MSAAKRAFTAPVPMDKALDANELIANFREMHSRGDLTDADYRKIKSVLGAKLHGGLKDDKDKV